MCAGSLWPHHPQEAQSWGQMGAKLLQWKGVYNSTQFPSWKMREALTATKYES